MCQNLNQSTLRTLIRSAIPPFPAFSNGGIGRTHDHDYISQFGDDSEHHYIDLLDEIRLAVAFIDPYPGAPDPETMRRLHHEIEIHFPTYPHSDAIDLREVEPGPIFFRPIIIMFRRYLDLWQASRATGYDTSDSERSSPASSRASSEAPRSPTSTRRKTPTPSPASRPPTPSHLFTPRHSPAPLHPDPGGYARYHAHRISSHPPSPSPPLPGRRFGEYPPRSRSPDRRGSGSASNIHQTRPHTAPQSLNPRHPGDSRHSELPSLLQKMKMTCISET
jgi:hypothetical protein